MNSNARPNVLIVDDSLGNIEVLGNILGAEYGVSFASSGQEGLDLANRYPMDLILLDVVMPGIDGFEVCRQLKADAKTRDIPVVFLTSLESAVDEEFGLRLGAEDFIHKPVSPPVVLARVRNHIQFASAKRELRRNNEHLEQLVAERTKELAKRNRQLLAAQTATVTAFCALAEARDNETGNHIRRTQNYVRVLAEELRSHPRFAGSLDDETIQLLFKSAPLHDVGKVAIPDAILLKPGKLTAEEWVIMKQHCVAGRNAIISSAQELSEGDDAFLGHAAQIAYCFPNLPTLPHGDLVAVTLHRVAQGLSQARRFLLPQLGLPLMRPRLSLAPRAKRVRVTDAEDIDLRAVSGLVRLDGRHGELCA